MFALAPRASDTSGDPDLDRSVQETIERISQDLKLDDPSPYLQQRVPPIRLFWQPGYMDKSRPRWKLNQDLQPLYDTDGFLRLDETGGIYMGEKCYQRYRQMFGETVGKMATEFMVTHEVMHHYEYHYGLIQESNPSFEVATDILAAYYMANKYSGDSPRMFALVKLNGVFGDKASAAIQTHGRPQTRVKAIASAIEAYRNRSWGRGLQPFLSVQTVDGIVSTKALDAAAALSSEVLASKSE